MASSVARDVTLHSADVAFLQVFMYEILQPPKDGFTGAQDRVFPSLFLHKTNRAVVAVPFATSYE